MSLNHPVTPSYALRFRRWSRQAYAVFASLGRCVTIGHVCEGITERALVKQLAPFITYHCEQTESERDDDDSPPTSITAFGLREASFIPQTSVSDPAPCAYLIRNSINPDEDAVNASCDFSLSRDIPVARRIRRVFLYNHPLI